jgi:hypothetical protein
MYNVILLFKKIVKVVNIKIQGVICMKVCFCTLFHLTSYTLSLNVSTNITLKIWEMCL